jgi:hypothetical protein
MNCRHPTRRVVGLERYRREYRQGLLQIPVVTEKISGHPGSLSHITRDTHQIMLDETQYVPVCSRISGSTVEKTEEGELHFRERCSRLHLKELRKVRQGVGKKRD